jgi:hypothetical protein
MRLAVPASLPGAPVCADAVRIRDIPVHKIIRRARIIHEKPDTEDRDALARDARDPWAMRVPAGLANAHSGWGLASRIGLLAPRGGAGVPQREITADAATSPA